MPPPAEIVGRRNELEALGRFLDATAGGSAALFLEGEAGIGKTRLWAEGVAAARGRDYRVVTTRPAAAEARLAFAGLSDLVEPLLEDAAEIPQPQRVALDAALLRAEPGAPVDRRAVAAAFLGTLRAAASETPLLVAVDDVQWLDPPTADALAFAFRRLEAERVGLLATVRVAPDEPDPEELRRAAGADRISRLVLEPLSVGALYELVRTRLGARLSRSTLLRVHETSAGNPFFALELARAMIETGAEPTPDEPLPVPRELAKLLRERLARLPPRANEVLLYVAALSQPTATIVEAAVPDASPALRDAADAAVVELEGETIRFTHPLLASTRYGAATARQRRAVHRALANAVTDPEERAMHLAAATDELEENVAAALEAAARRAERRGALAAAAHLADKAVALTPRPQAPELHRRRVAAARLALMAGNSTRAEVLLESALAAATRPRDRAEVLCAVGDTRVATKDIRAALEPYRAAADEAAGDAALRASILVRMVHPASYWGGGFEVGREHAREAVELAEQAGDAALLARALATLAWVEFTLGVGIDHASFERAEALEAASGSFELDGGAAVRYARLLADTGDFDRARERLERLCAYGRRTGDAAVAWPLVFLSSLEEDAGDLRRASELAGEARDVAALAGREVVEPVALFALAGIEGVRGELDLARHHALEALRMTERAGRLSGGPRTILARVDVSAERYAAAWEAVAPAVRRYRERGAVGASMTSAAVEALARLGQSDEAEALLVPWEERAQRLGVPWEIAASSRARGLVEAARGDLVAAVRALERAVAVGEGVPMMLELGQSLLALGEVQRRLQRKKDARETLNRALATFEELGAPVWAERARRELRRIGGRAAAAEGLSETEERIAALVREGRTNREVAEALHLSPHTVEWNLSRIYRKLGVRSRTELAARS